MSAIRVVIVDDHQVVVESLQLALSRHADIQVDGAAFTRDDGLALAIERRPDVVLLDFNLGDGDATDLIGLLIDRVPGVRIVVLTAHTAEDVLARCLRAGAHGFVSKQQSVQDVAAAIRTAAAGQMAVTSDALAAALPALRNDASAPARPTLTQREHEVLALLAEGLPNRDIADRLYLSVNTVRNHVAAVLSKLGARTRTGATAIAHRDGWLDRRR